MPPQAKMKAPRGKNFDSLEDEMISRLWVRLSTKEANSTNQTAERFWTRIRAEFYKEPKIKEKVDAGVFEVREWGSFRSRFKHISGIVNKLIKCVREIERREGSGKSPNGVWMEAVQLFELKARLGSDSKKPGSGRREKTAFTQPAAYKVLSKCPEFIRLSVDEEVEPPTKRRSQHTDDEAPERISIRAAKRSKQETRSTDQIKAIGEKLLLAAQDRADMLRHLVIAHTFATTPIDEEHAYILARQRAILKLQLEEEYGRAMSGRKSQMPAATTQCESDRGHALPTLCEEDEEENSVAGSNGSSRMHDDGEDEAAMALHAAIKRERI